MNKYIFRIPIKRYFSDYNPLIEIEKINVNKNIEKKSIYHEICKNIKNNPMLETEKSNSYICKIKCKNLSKCKNIKPEDNPL